jgi:Mn-dependent DtxR family transcriptional regulator
MPYQRSLEIEQRLQAVLLLIRSGTYSTPMLAKRLGVSIPTVSRHVTALRARGHRIRSERRGERWRYVLAPGTAKGRRADAQAVFSEARS